MTLSRVDDFDEELSGLRVENAKAIKDLEKEARSWVDDAKEVLRTQIQPLEGLLESYREEMVTEAELEKQMVPRIEEENRLSRSIKEVKTDFDELKTKYEEQLRQFRLQKEETLKDSKRITDLRGELNALRKRLDQQRGRMDLIETDTKKINTRIEEVNTQHRELVQEQKNFLEKESLRSAERESLWKTWEARFETIEKQAIEIDEQLQSMDATHRAVKRMQEEITDLSERVDRRVNEITEMQRLAEERFRQEWNTFKADDQKRWMNYTLSQKEQRGELERGIGKMEERLTILEDTSQEIQDQVQQIGSQVGKQLQALLNLSRDWVSEYEQLLDGLR
jgi:chromosome segregation ATPase